MTPLHRLPMLSRPGPQIALATASSAAVGIVWFLTREPVGSVVAFGLIALPLFNAPFELCLGFIVLSHFRLPEVFPVLRPFRLPELAAIACLAALIWHLAVTRRIRLFWCSELTLITVFFVLMTIGVVTAVDRPLALAFWSGYFVKVAAMTFAVAWLARGPKEFATVTWAVTLAGLAVGCVALWNKIHGIGLVEGTRVTIGRDIGSILGDPNDLALTLLFPTAFALGLAFTHGIPKAGRWFGAATFIILVLAILATQSRGGVMGLLAVLVPFVGRRVKSKMLLVVVAIAVGGVLFVAADIGDRATVGDVSEIDESAMGRLNAWKTAFNMALHRPLTGVGVDNFAGQYYFFTDQWAGKGLAAHSVWFQVLGETGFVGLAVYLSMLGVTASKLLRAGRRLQSRDADPAVRAIASALVAGLAGFAVSGTFLSQAYGWPAFLLLALSIAISRFGASGNIGGTPHTPGAWAPPVAAAPSPAPRNNRQ